MSKSRIFAKITNGHLDDNAELLFLYALCAHEGKDVRVTIERKRKQRSLSQNKYYWGVVIPAVRGLLLDYGNEVDDEETHSFLKEHVGKLTTSVVGKSGRRVAITKSSASLSTAEFEEYLLRVRKFAAQEGVQIPEPNEHLYQPMGERA